LAAATPSKRESLPQHSTKLTLGFTLFCLFQHGLEIKDRAADASRAPVRQAHGEETGEDELEKRLAALRQAA